MKNVIGIGNALVDILTRLEDDRMLEGLGLPKGSMQLADKTTIERILPQISHLITERSSGGSAANTIHGLARLGIPASFIGMTGNDDSGRFFRNDMISAGIRPELFISETETGRAIALISPDSERTFATYLGAAAELTASDINPGLFEGYEYFYIEGYLVQNHDLIRTAAEMAKKAGLKVCLDLASYNVVEANLEFLGWLAGNLTDILFANEEEARVFTGKEPEEAIHDLSRLTGTAILKTGKKGSLVGHKGIVHQIAAIDANPVDTTGAGDLYASGFIYGLIKGYTLEECGRTGSILAGNVIEVNGAKMDESRWNTIREMIRR